MDVFVEGRVRRIVAELVGVAETMLEPHVSLREDLALDSLDLVELVTALEDDLRVTLPVDLPPWVRTYGDLVELARLLVPLRAPEVRMVLQPLATGTTTRVIRCTELTPYAIENIRDEARRLGEGALLDVTTDHAQDVAVVRSALEPVAADGVHVRVHGPPAPARSLTSAVATRASGA
jgi:acyl carrier protein